MRILLIEDDSTTAEYIANGLTEAGHVCDVLADGRDGLLPGAGTVRRHDRGSNGPRSGWALQVKVARAAGVRIPVIFLTAIGGIDDRVDGLEAGGDDYLVKPFAFSELAARVNALGRRLPTFDQKATACTNVTWDFASAWTSCDALAFAFLVKPIWVPAAVTPAARSRVLKVVFAFNGNLL
jgi:two-component system, OmpR family, response regulator